MLFRSKEARGGEDTVRKALSFLTTAGFLVRPGGATYAIDEVKGPMDWESARALRGWQDP